MDVSQLLSEHGLAVVIIFCLFGAISWFAKWFFINYTKRLDDNFEECIREVVEIKIEVLESNKKLYNIIEKLIANQRLIGEDINALDKSLNTLLKFIQKDK
jgi:hypothetical protein